MPYSLDFLEDSRLSNPLPMGLLLYLLDIEDAVPFLRWVKAYILVAWYTSPVLHLLLFALHRILKLFRIYRTNPSFRDVFLDIFVVSNS